ncbi:MAG: septum formation initiator family protein [Bacteroidales bacterium]|jgi:cell division protein FtsB|nr:septum formation initiator family protein [Bacteroidales bacterium]
MARFSFPDRIPSFFRNKYVLTIVLFLIWILLLDSNNLISRYREMRELKKLRNQKEYYINKIEEESRKLRELKTGNDNLEKFAREEYRMKKPDEDLYIILTPREERKISRQNQ